MNWYFLIILKQLKSSDLMYRSTLDSQNLFSPLIFGKIDFKIIIELSF